jgi:small subunit ribosomal protein S16
MSGPSHASPAGGGFSTIEAPDPSGATRAGPASSAWPQTEKRDNEVAVKLRLMRMGKTKQPTYRVVAADARSPRNGRFIEIIGTYEPRRDPSVINIDNDRAVHYLGTGAQPTDRVEKLLKISGAWEQAGRK